MPTFSIITVTYNAQDTIRPTMSSVAQQTCTDYEHIIVDGASTDNTIKYVTENINERTRIVSEKDHGIYDAMNKGISLSQGQYLIFLNAGDTFHTCDTLAHMLNAIKANNRPGIVYGQTDLVDSNRQYLRPRHLEAPVKLTLKSFANGMVVCHQSMAVLKKITCPYDTRYRYSADYEWVIKCLQHSRNNVYLDEVIVDYLEEGMTTRNHSKSLIERFKIMCRYYGTCQTIMRHLKFGLRHTYRRLTTDSKQ